jgi:uncharacterized membrane protein YbhN (UPF0104 family)
VRSPNSARHPDPAPPARSGRLALRILGGALLLVAVVWYVEPGALAAQLAGVRWGWFGLAVLVAVGANVASAWRWAAIARALELIAPTMRLLWMYARGVTTNVLLPGATLSGDLLRSYQLAGLGNPFLRSALSVLFDRLSGLWVLCVLSLLAVPLAALLRHRLPEGIEWYVLVLLAVIVAPLLPWPTGILRRMPFAPIQRIGERVDALRARIEAAGPALMRSLWMSVLVQVLSAAALWVCALAVGLQLPYWTVLAAAAPIFILAALPLGVAGFGTRELGAVLVLGFLGVPSEQATAASLLFGLCTVVQGILAAPLFFTKA